MVSVECVSVVKVVDLFQSDKYSTHNMTQEMTYSRKFTGGSATPKTRRLKNKFYIKYFIRDAGNDSPKLDRQIDQLLHQLEKMIT